MLLGALREHLWDTGVLFSTMAEGMAEKGAKFSDYFDYREPIKVIPSHRALALFRGRNENVLHLKLTPGDEAAVPEGQVFTGPGECELKIARRFNVSDRGRPADAWLAETVRSDAISSRVMMPGFTCGISEVSFITSAHISRR